MKLQGLEITDHTELRLKQRFGMTYQDVLKVQKYFKKGNCNCRHRVVRNKLVRYANQSALYNEGLNMLLMVDTYNDTIVNVLYLDGRNGYDFQR